MSGGAATLDPDGASSPTVRTAAVALATQIRLVDMEPPAERSTKSQYMTNPAETLMSSPVMAAARGDAR